MPLPLSLHWAFKWVVGFGEEPGASQGVGVGGLGGVDPETATMTSYQSWMPERGEESGREGWKKKEVDAAEPFAEELRIWSPPQGKNDIKTPPPFFDTASLFVPI